MRGGKRENAGRKKGEPTTTISVRIPLKYEKDFKIKLIELKKHIDGYENQAQDA